MRGARIGYLADFVNPASATAADVSALAQQALSDLDAAGAVRVPLHFDAADPLFALQGEIAGSIAAAGKDRYLWDRYLPTLGGVDFTGGDSGPFGTFLNRSWPQLFSNHPALYRAVSVAALLDKLQYSYDPAKESELFSKQIALQEFVASYMDAQEIEAIVIPPVYNPALLEAGPERWRIEQGVTLSISYLADDLISGLSSLPGLPALIVPAGFTPAGIPHGLQFVARAFDEAALIKLGYAYEQAARRRRGPSF